MVGVIWEGPQQDMFGIKVGLVHWSQDRLLIVEAKCGTSMWTVQDALNLEMFSESYLWHPPLESDTSSVLGENSFCSQSTCAHAEQHVNKASSFLCWWLPFFRLLSYAWSQCLASTCLNMTQLRRAGFSSLLSGTILKRTFILPYP